MPRQPSACGARGIGCDLLTSQEIQTPKPSNSERILELDGIRGVAILLVVLYHYVAVPIPADASAGLLFVRQLFSNNWSGVDLFFVLSGFLITGILIDHRNTRHYFKVFYIRRISRIFPLYYLFLSLFLLAQYFSAAHGFIQPGSFRQPIANPAVLPLSAEFLHGHPRHLWQ